MRILFAGGGTMGPAVPLIAVAEEIRRREPNTDFFWIGTKNGPEREVVANYNMVFKAIPAGKWRRYLSMENLTDIIKNIGGFFEALFLLIKIKPDVIASAGGYVAVSVVWAGWLLGIPVVIHQQDVRVGLANKLCATAAKKITVCFAETAVKFRSKKTIVIGNPVREGLRRENIESAKRKLSEELGLDEKLPLVLITTGGSGALSINAMIRDAIGEILEHCQIVHLTGKDKDDMWRGFEHKRYRQFDFLADDTEALLAADLFISRAGMGTLSEISWLSKPAVVVPIPNSHQVENAEYFAKRQAIEYVDQSMLDDGKLTRIILNLLEDKVRMGELGQRAHEAMNWDNPEKKLAEIVFKAAMGA